jgi:hypothetical protein
VPETKDSTAVSWPAVSAAVALLTSHRAGSADAQADLVGDVPPGEVIAALEILGSVFLGALAPGGPGDRVLQFLGLRALERAQQ